MSNNFVKILGAIFDDRLNLEKHINNVVSTCYDNLLNLGRIASKLTTTLKVQLVNFLILFRVDYCKALFYNIPKYLLHELTKVLYCMPQLDLFLDFMILLLVRICYHI